MIELDREYAAEQEEVLFELDMTPHEYEWQKVAVTVDIPSEFQALLSGLSSDGGKDSTGKIIKLWKISGIQSIDFVQSEPGKTMVFNLEHGSDEGEVYLRLTEWLSDLRARRQRTERILASSAIRS